jgi:ABC-2 type transport system ATP-binding protein
MASVEELCDHIALINRSEKILEGRVAEIKRTYRSNTYRIIYDNPAHPLPEILDHQFEITDQPDEGDYRVSDINLPFDKDPNYLLSKLIPHTTLHGFSEMLPTMNEIFISKVNEYSPMTHE